jgi:choline dehydrogenase-like flavoprotein
VPDDLDRWEAAGCTGWGWGEMLPYFRKLETDKNFPANPVFSLAEVRIEFMHEMIGSHYGWAATTRAPSIFRSDFRRRFQRARIPQECIRSGDLHEFELGNWRVQVRT